ncbi:MAG TPA: helix-turn-helix transcriptional regulator [Methylotenera sp.]|mgnify:CR=1 FL=1|nr:helix-turn-helix transcriptional regulator [Methylotenera sp.]HPH06405.1 helix-turn-helix transcriptional regulator [Methylotenera sp.]HPN01819.1 helix-turn-helix transcriptional regulator [Methylotenera sp.]
MTANSDKLIKKELPVFSKRLKEARLKLGISQAKLGIAAKIDESSSSARVNQYERGKHYPDYQTAERLAQILNVPTPYLFAREDELAEWILQYKTTMIR